MEHHESAGPGTRRRPRSAPAPEIRPRPDRALRPAFPLSPGPARIEVRAAEPPEHVFRRLLGAYLGGAPEFLVHEAPSLRATTRGIVRTFARRTRQPEIVSDDGDEILLRDLAFDSPVPLERRLEQMGQHVIRFHEEAVASWTVLPLGEDDSWEHRDDEIDREAWYLERKARLRLGQAPPSLELWVVARSLERIADHAVILGEAGRRLAGLPHGRGPLATLGQFHAQAMEHLAGVLATRDESGANDLLDTGEALLASGRAISDRLLPAGPGVGLSPAAAAAVARILESIQRTVAYGQDVAQVVLDRSLASVDLPAPLSAAPGPLPAP
ncbi:MAG TPA: PhoU domain-containing protein [Thermoplasmata archaeon]|nr:PhoU domain-containing protein [Thermoplasmata archaeon]